MAWNLARRILGRWRWYACSLLVSYGLLIRLPITKKSSFEFAISGETESLGSNNIMGQWLKSMGGYTVEQIGHQFSTSDLSEHWQVHRLLSLWCHCRRNRIHIDMRYLDRFHARPLACASLHIDLRYHCCGLSSGTEQSDRTQVFRILWVAWVMSIHSFKPIYRHCRCFICGAGYDIRVCFHLFACFSSKNPFISPHSWANEICADDDQERGIVLASMKSVIVIYYFRSDAHDT